MTQFSAGQPVMWFYWHPKARFRYWQRVDAEVIRTTASRVIVRCWDKEGKEVVRYVNPDSLLTADRPGFERGVNDPLHGDGTYPA